MRVSSRFLRFGPVGGNLSRAEMTGNPNCGAQTLAELAPRRGNMIQVWSPRPEQMQGPLGEATARCLATAFSSREWAATPMPLGDDADPHSARGIIAQLGKQAQVLVANVVEDDHGRNVLGCVLGAVLDRTLVDAYGLASYGAQSGDALLAYIGLMPAAQGRRAALLSNNIFELSFRRSGLPSIQEGQSLAALLFERWLELSVIESCPRVFVRTRKVLAPIIHLAEKNGFCYRGEFELDFQGERQDRIVFARDNSFISRRVERDSMA